jgi:hypothetical protein
MEESSWVAYEARVGCPARELLQEGQQVIVSPGYSQRATEVDEQVRKEDGVATAFDALAKLLRNSN